MDELDTVLLSTVGSALGSLTERRCGGGGEGDSSESRVKEEDDTSLQ